MSDEIEVENDVGTHRLTIDTDGYHFNDPNHMNEFNTVTIPFDVFEEMMDFAGWTKKMEHDKVRQERDVVVEALLEQESFEEMHPADVDDLLLEALSGEMFEEVVAVELETGDTFVGMVDYRGDSEQSGPGTYTAPIRVLGGDIDPGGVIAYGTYVYEPQTRHYPGYEGFEELGIKVEDTVYMVEHFEVIG